MALTTQKTKIRYRGNGVTTYFPIPFPVLSAAHVQVFTPGVGGVSEVMTSGFDVMEEDARTYAVVFYEPLPSGQEITIARILELEQNLDLENGGNFSAEEIETTFDVVVMLIQQLAEILERCVKTGIVAEESGLSVEEIYAQLEEIVAKAEQALEDIKNIQEPVILAKGITNLRGTWTTEEALPAGSVLRMPVGYFPGREMLLLMMDGFTCYPVNEYETANIQQYEEMGSEDEVSRDVKILFDAPAGAVWSAWAIASNVGPLQEELLEQTQQAKDLAIIAANDANIARQKAENFAGQAEEIVIPTMSATVRGSARVGRGLSITDNDVLGVYPDKGLEFTEEGALAITTPVPVFNGVNLKLIVNSHGQMEWAPDVSPIPSMTGPMILNGTTDNYIAREGIVTTLGLEVGDVIRIQYSGYDKLHTVESIADNNLIRVNYEHAGNRGNGSLKLPDTTASATITRIAKWYNAPAGMGQAWVVVTASRAAVTTYTNATGRSIVVNITSSHRTIQNFTTLTIDGVVVRGFGDLGSTGYSGYSWIVPPRATYQAAATAGILDILDWLELR